MKRALSILFAWLLSACAANPGPNTPSGNLTITVTNVRRDCAREIMAQAIRSYGYHVASQSDYQIIAGRMRPELSVEERLTILFLVQHPDDALKIVIYASSVSHPGTAFESFQPTRPTQIEQTQFEVLKDKIQGDCAGRGR